MRFFNILILLLVVSVCNQLLCQMATEDAFAKTLQNNAHITTGKLTSKHYDLLGCDVMRLQLEYTLTENKPEACYDGDFTLKWIRNPEVDINCPFRATDFLPFCLYLKAASPQDSSKSYTFTIQDFSFVFAALANQFTFKFKYRHKDWPDGIRILDFQVFSMQRQYLESFRYRHPLFSAIFYPETPGISDYRDNMEIISASCMSGTYLDMENGVHTIYTKKVSFAPKVGVFRSGEKDLDEFIKKHKKTFLSLRFPILDGKEYTTEDLIWKGKKCRDIYTTINQGKENRQFVYHRFVELGNGNYLIIQMKYRYIKDKYLGPDKKSGLAFLKNDMVILSHFFNSFDFE